MFSSLSKPFTVAWLSVSEWYLLVFGVVLVVGLVGEFLADHKGKRYSRLKKRKRLFEILVIAGVAGELLADGGIFLFGAHLQTFAELEVASLNKEAAEARLETAKIKQQMAQTSTTIANLDASKWPVHSVTAEVRLRFDRRQELDGDLIFPALLTISPSGNVGPAKKVLLSCNNAIHLENASMSLYVLQFSSAFGPVSIPIAIPLLPGQDAKTACDTLDMISLQITNFPVSNVKVISGSATVTINEILRKRFLINSGNINNGFAVLTGVANTNVPIIFLKSK